MEKCGALSKCRKEVLSSRYSFGIGARIEEYQDARLNEGAARATVNRQCAYLRRGYKLLYEAKPRRLSELPVIKMLEGENVREGFINVADFEAVAALIKNEDTRDTLQSQYGCAWWSKEVVGLEWSKVDLTDWVIRLSRKNSKNKKPGL